MARPASHPPRPVHVPEHLAAPWTPDGPDRDTLGRLPEQPPPGLIEGPAARSLRRLAGHGVERRPTLLALALLGAGPDLAAFRLDLGPGGSGQAEGRGAEKFALLWVLNGVDSAPG